MANEQEPQIVGFLGVGLDNEDGEKRFTRSEHFFIVGGSQDTHERMQDTAIRFADGLKRQGKELQETTLAEVIELLHKARE